jgi:AcrR family transcriptional regulator
MARPRKFVETEVVRAARDQFWDTGYAGTSLDDLTAATGLGRGSLYKAFGDKHELYVRAFDDYCAVSIENTRVELTADVPAYQRLVDYLHSAAESVIADASQRGCMLAKGTAELAGDDPAIAARSQATFASLQEILMDCVAEAQRDGALDPAADPAQVAGVMLAVQRGLEAIGKSGMPPEILRGVACHAIAQLPRT